MHGKIKNLNSISGFRIPGIGGVKEETHDKNVEMEKCEMPEYVDPTPFQSFGYQEIEKSRVETLQHMSLGVAKSRIPNSRNRHINEEFHRLGNKSILEFRIPGVGRVKTLHHQESWNHEM